MCSINFFPWVILSGLLDTMVKMHAGAKGYTATGLCWDTGKANF
jgi:hypothetical protein